MPYKSERIPIAGTEYDRSRKLTDEQKETIRKLRKEDALSFRQLATMFGVSKRLVMYVCDPDKYEIAKEQRRQRWKDGRYRQSKAEHAATIRRYRQHKQYVYLLKQLFYEQNQ